MPNDTEVQQLIIYVGTQAKIDEARQAGTIGPDDFAVVTDAPDFQTKLTSANAGTGISITEVGGVVKISNTQTSAEWGNIQGTISSQTDLWNYLSEIGVLSNLTTTEKATLVGAINEVNSTAVSALQPSDVINNTASTVTDKPLSANMGKSLQDQVDNLKARGRFLALWNCATGLAQSNPPESPYTYQSGDYFIVGTISSADPAVNYKPNGSTYTTGVASVTVETNEVAVDDVYYYDGTNWRLQSNTQKTVSFVNIAGDPYDNTNLASALNNKISGVKVNGTELTPDADKKVNVTVPTVNNATLTIQKNGTNVATFTANSSTDATANIAVPTDTNELSNGAGYITNSALSNYVTLNTMQTLTSAKKMFANDALLVSNQTALFATISNSNTTTSDNAWVGRYICGAKNLTFLMGTYRTMAGIGAHSWTNAQTGAGAGWADFYLNPDGNMTVFIGGNGWTKNSGWLKVKNSGSNSGGLVQVNKGTISSASWKDVAYKGENVSDFNNDANYITSSAINNPTITITQGGETKGSFTLNQASGDTIALDAGGGSSYTAGTGIDITNNEISVTSPTLVNTATGTNALTLLGNPSNKKESVNIGYNSECGYRGGTAVGYNTKVGYTSIAIGHSANANSVEAIAVGYAAETNTNSIAIGSGAHCYAQYSIALGNQATVFNGNNYAIQLGQGANTEASTFCVGFNGTNYKLLDGTTGKIPDGRLPIATSVSSSSTNADVVGAKLFYDTCGDIETLINAL